MRTRPLLAVLSAALAILVMPGLVSARQDWSIDSDRSSVPKNDSTAVRLTITNSDDKIACVGIFVPSKYGVDSAAVVSVSNGGNWSTSIGGGSFHWVLAKAQKNSELDDGERLVLRVTVTGKVSGRSDWTVWAFGRKDCKDGGNWSAIGLVMAVSGTVAAPRPTPKPTPRPAPRPKSTPKPTPRAVPARTEAPRSTPKPVTQPKLVQTKPAPTLAPVAIVRSITPPRSGDDGSGALPSDYFSIPLDDSPTFGGLALDLLAALGVFAWAVPGALLTVPGLLLFAIIGAQMFGAFAWLPIVRRKLRGTGVSRDRGAPTPSR